MHTYLGFIFDTGLAQQLGLELLRPSEGILLLHLPLQLGLPDGHLLGLVHLLQLIYIMHTWPSWSPALRWPPPPPPPSRSRISSSPHSPLSRPSSPPLASSSSRSSSPCQSSPHSATSAPSGVLIRSRPSSWPLRRRPWPGWPPPSASSGRGRITHGPGRPPAASRSRCIFVVRTGSAPIASSQTLRA